MRKWVLLFLLSALALSTPARAVQIDPGALEVAYKVVKEGLCAADITCALPDDMILPLVPNPGPDEFWRYFYTGEVILSSWYSKPLEVPLEALKRMYETTGAIPQTTIVYPAGERERFWKVLDWIRKEPVCRNLKLVEAGQTDVTVYAGLGAEWVPLVIHPRGILIGWQLGDSNGWFIPVGPTFKFWYRVARFVASLADAGKQNAEATEDPKEKFADPDTQPHPEAAVVPAEEFCIEEETP